MKCSLVLYSLTTSLRLTLCMVHLLGASVLCNHISLLMPILSQQVVTYTQLISRNDAQTFVVFVTVSLDLELTCSCTGGECLTDWTNDCSYCFDGILSWGSDTGSNSPICFKLRQFPPVLFPARQNIFQWSNPRWISDYNPCLEHFETLELHELKRNLRGTRSTRAVVWHLEPLSCLYMISSTIIVLWLRMSKSWIYNGFKMKCLKR